MLVKKGGKRRNRGGAHLFGRRGGKKMRVGQIKRKKKGGEKSGGKRGGALHAPLGQKKGKGKKKGKRKTI